MYNSINCRRTDFKLYSSIFGIFVSIGNAFYYYPQQILDKRVNEEGNFQKYITKDQILKYVVSIILPILLGYCISKNSYNLAFIILIILFWFEIMTNIPRSFGYLILIFVSKIGFNLNIIAILIVAFSIIYIVFAYTLNKITKNYLIA